MGRRDAARNTRPENSNGKRHRRGERFVQRGSRGGRPLRSADVTTADRRGPQRTGEAASAAGEEPCVKNAALCARCNITECATNNVAANNVNDNTMAVRQVAVATTETTATESKDVQVGSKKQSIKVSEGCTELDGFQEWWEQAGSLYSGIATQEWEDYKRDYAVEPISCREWRKKYRLEAAVRDSRLEGEKKCAAKKTRAAESCEEVGEILGVAEKQQTATYSNGSTNNRKQLVENYDGICSYPEDMPPTSDSSFKQENEDISSEESDDCLQLIEDCGDYSIYKTKDMVIHSVNSEILGSSDGESVHGEIEQVKQTDTKFVQEISTKPSEMPYFSEDDDDDSGSEDCGVDLIETVGIESNTEFYEFTFNENDELMEVKEVSEEASVPMIQKNTTELPDPEISEEQIKQDPADITDPKKKEPPDDDILIRERTEEAKEILSPRKKEPPNIVENIVYNMSWDNAIVDQDLLWEEHEGSEKSGVKQSIIPVSIYDIIVPVLLDTGAQLSVISKPFFDLISDKPGLVVMSVTGVKILGATGKMSKPVKLQVLAEFYVKNVRFEHDFLLVSDLNSEIVLGIDWLDKEKVVIDCSQQVVRINHPERVIKITFEEVPNKSGDNQGSLAFVIDQCHDGLTQLFELYHLKEQRDESKDENFHEIVKNLQNLSESQKNEILDLLRRNQDVFSGKPGRLRNFEYQMEILEHEPFFVKPYPVPLAKKQAVQNEIDSMLEWQVIERSNSEYNSPLIVVNKRDGGVRVVLDARTLNKIIKREIDRPENLEEILQKFNNVKYLTSLDLTASYWQIPLSKESRKYTAFLFAGKCYHYKVVPFGLNTSVSAFIRALDSVLGKELSSRLTIYVDDILIATETWAEHCELLDKVFQALKAGGMTLKLKKCEFVRREIKFLGHFITTEGIRKDPEKLTAISNCPAPKTKKQLKSFLALCGFYRNFVKGQEFNSEKLNKLLKKNSAFIWTDECQQDFEKLKSALTQDNLLYHPILLEPYHLSTDSSDYGIGAEMFQEIETNEGKVHRTIACASRTLSKFERNYTVSEKEALAIIWALKKFRVYLWGHKIIIHTDHKALTFLKDCKLLNGRLTRWALYLSQFDYEIVYVKGSENMVADCLSRLPENMTNLPSNSNDEGMFRINCMKNIGGQKKIQQICKNMRYHQNNDEVWKSVKTKFGNVNFPQIEKHYKIFQGVLFKRKNLESEVWRVCWPSQFENEIIDYFHLALGHCGTKKCIEKLSDVVVILNNVTKKVGSRIKSCDLCQKTKVSNKTHRGPMQSNIPNDSLDILSVDLYGPLPKTVGNWSYILVVLDIFSKYIKLYPIRKATAKSVFSKMKGYFNNVGKPKSVLSDNGPQFISKIWKQGMSDLGIEVKYISAYHPSSNPVERSMREIGRLCRAYCHHNHRTWGKFVQEFESVMNTWTHETTGFSPEEILFNKRNKSVVENALPFPPNKDLTWDEKKQLVRDRMKKKAEARAKRHDKDLKFSKFKVGNEVLVKTHEKSCELTHEISKFKFIYHGPFKIQSCPHENAFFLTYPSGRPLGVRNITHLKPYIPRK